MVQPSTATVANLLASGAGAPNTIKWYAAATGGTALLSTATLATGTYYAADSDGICESAVRTPVLASVVTVSTPLWHNDSGKRFAVQELLLI